MLTATAAAWTSGTGLGESALMNKEALIVAILAGIGAWALVEIWIHWRASRAASKVIDHALHPDSYPSRARSGRDPESRFVLRLSDSEIACERPDGKVERVAWADLQKVEVVTTSAGPFAPDVFWVLHGTEGGCAVPQGATDNERLLERLQTLPGFDNGTFIEAMSSTDDRRFTCWQRPA